MLRPHRLFALLSVVSLALCAPAAALADTVTGNVPIPPADQRVELCKQAHERFAAEHPLPERLPDNSAVLAGCAWDNLSGVRSIRLSVKVDDAHAEICTVRPRTPAWRCVWDHTGFAPGRHVVTMRIADRAGNVATYRKRITIGDRSTETQETPPDRSAEGSDRAPLPEPPARAQAPSPATAVPAPPSPQRLTTPAHDVPPVPADPGSEAGTTTTPATTTPDEAPSATTTTTDSVSDAVEGESSPPADETGARDPPSTTPD